MGEHWNGKMYCNTNTRHTLKGKHTSQRNTQVCRQNVVTKSNGRLSSALIVPYEVFVQHLNRCYLLLLLDHHHQPQNHHIFTIFEVILQQRLFQITLGLWMIMMARTPQMRIVSLRWNISVTLLATLHDPKQTGSLLPQRYHLWRDRQHPQQHQLHLWNQQFNNITIFINFHQNLAPLPSGGISGCCPLEVGEPSPLHSIVQTHKVGTGWCFLPLRINKQPSSSILICSISSTHLVQI